MASYKEIVTKAIIGKAKKTNEMHFSFTPDENVDTVLGCWVINHNFHGTNASGKVGVNGAFDVNVWYSYEGDTKIKVPVEDMDDDYEEIVDEVVVEDIDSVNENYLDATQE